MNVKTAKQVTGGLSSPSKMPSYGYSIPAIMCLVGGMLRDVAGSVCEGCYAMKGNYMFPNVADSLMNRLHQMLNNPLWIDGMVFQILRYCTEPYFRWHDSGDLQSISHLEKIVEVVKQTPDINHWLPTRENGIIVKYLKKHGTFPPNLCVRVSSAMINGKPVTKFANTSTVITHGNETGSNVCPAPTQGNMCGDCRMCWDSDTPNVAYLKH